MHLYYELMALDQKVLWFACRTNAPKWCVENQHFSYSIWTGIEFISWNALVSHFLWTGIEFLFWTASVSQNTCPGACGHVIWCRFVGRKCFFSCITYMKTRQEPHLKMSYKCFTVAAIALFSASEQTHCILVVCDWMSDCSFTQYLLQWIATEVVTAFISCYITGALWNCCCFGTHSVYTVRPYTGLQCHFIWSHTCRVHVCLAVTCHLHSGRSRGMLYVLLQ